MRRRVVVIMMLLLCAGLIVTSASKLQASQQTSGVATARGRDGVVASANQYATQAGIEILKAGGNAVDAAVAAAAALGVADPFEAGIGGGGFMVIYLKAENRVITIDGRETAPLSARPNLFKDPNSPAGENLPLMPNRISSGAAVGVPGTLLTWSEALNRYGRMPLAKVLRPAIALAEQGFRANPTYVRFLVQNQERFAAFRSTRALFFPAGRVPATGTRITNPDLAKTYRLIAQKGPNVFYRGDIGKAIVATVQQPPTVQNPPFRVLPGEMTLTDLDSYEVQVRMPVTTTYRGYKLYGMGLPSSGGITSIQALNLLEGYSSKLDRAKVLHYLIESERLAYADRSAYLGDPEFVDVPLVGLTSKAYAKARRALITEQAPANEKRYQASSGNPFPYQQDPSPSRTITASPIDSGRREGLSTAHLTVADRFGNVVAYTLTIEQTGGSGIVVPGYGFLLNNELTDFNLDIPNPNSPEPGKRPLSSMAPTMIFAPDGRVMAFGSPGGATIITTVLGIATHLIDFQQGMAQAIAAPRLSQRNNGVTQVDQGLEKTALGRKLVSLGHELEPVAEMGAATGVVVNPDGIMTAAAEPVRRGGGTAMVVTPTSR